METVSSPSRRNPPAGRQGVGSDLLSGGACEHQLHRDSHADPYGNQRATSAALISQPTLGGLAGLSGEKGTWVSRRELLQVFYRGLKDKENSFDTDRSRILLFLQEKALKHGFILGEVFEHGKNEHDEAVWRLKAICERDDQATDLLDIWSEKVAAIEAGTLMLARDQLLAGCEEVIHLSAGGYLANHPLSEREWSWARPLFLTYREKYLTLLSSVAARERQGGEQATEQQRENSA